MVEKDREGQPSNPLRAWQLLFISVIALGLLNIRIRHYFKESVNMNIWALLQVHFPLEGLILDGQQKGKEN